MIGLKPLRRWLVLPLVFLMHFDTVGAATRLVDAIRQGDKAGVRALLNQRVDVNTSEADGTTALHWAVYMDDLESANLLIRAGARVATTNRLGVTPLSLASINGNAPIVESLLKAGADPNTASREGETALMTAARTGKADAVKVLVAGGADVNRKENWRGQTALMWAAAEGHAQAVQALVEGGADLPVRSQGGLTAFLFGVREGKIDVVRTLLKAGANVNDTTLPPPPTRGRVQGSAAPLEPQAGTSALVMAVANAHFELASLLLDAGADPNAAGQGWTALHQVTWIRKPGTGTNNPAPEGSGNIGSLEIVKKLVAKGADVNARMVKRGDMGTSELNVVGATPFMLAARTADAELMRVLAQLGADPLLPNADNTTPLLAAAGVGTASPGEDAGTEREALEAIRVAFELGGNVNAVDNNGNSAMHGAAIKQFPAVVRFLVANGARIEVWNQKNKLGWTPLMIANGVQRGNNIRSSEPTAEAIRAAMTVQQTQ
jgi:ankyrin repeat protein